MRLLIAGGAGYIGSVMTELLLQRGAQVIVYDNLSTGHRRAIPPEAHFVEGDLADRAALDDVLARFRLDAVMHFAAFILVGESMEVPHRYFANNVANVINLLNVMQEHGVRRFVFSSSAAVYGEPAELPITEECPTLPNNPYGESKLMVERVLHWYDQILGLRYASLRYFNAAGASAPYGEDHQPETHLIPIVLRTALGQQEFVPINGTDYPTPDGTCIRDYIHVLDLAEAHLQALAHLERGSVVCNLGSDRGHSVREVLAVARQVTGRAIPTREGPRRPGDAVAQVASSQRARHLLGWQPRYGDLTTIVGTAWAWHQRFPKGYQE